MTDASSDCLTVESRVELELVDICTRIPKLVFDSFCSIVDYYYLACRSEADALSVRVARVVHLSRLLYNLCWMLKSRSLECDNFEFIRRL